MMGPTPSALGPQRIMASVCKGFRALCNFFYYFYLDKPFVNDFPNCIMCCFPEWRKLCPYVAMCRLTLSTSCRFFSLIQLFMCILWLVCGLSVNSLRPGDIIPWSTLVQVMACCLFSIKPLPESELRYHGYCQLNLHKLLSMGLD